MNLRKVKRSIRNRLLLPRVLDAQGDMITLNLSKLHHPRLPRVPPKNPLAKAAKRRRRMNLSLIP